MSKKFFIFPAFLVVALMFAGCGQTTSTNSNKNTTKNTNSTKTNSATTTNTSSAAKYAVSITAPKDAATVSSSFDLAVSVSGFTLAPDSIEKDNVEGQGHYHVWVDGEYFSQGATPTVTVKDVTAGEHEIMVSLQNNDHTDLSPAVKSEAIILTVE